MSRRLASLAVPVALSLALAAPLVAVPDTTDVGTELGLAPVVPRPDLGTMEPAARGRIERAQAGLDRLLADPATPRALLGEAFGQLGMVFQAFKLLDAAGLAYDEARARQPKDPRWLYLRGVVHHAKGDLEPAAATYAAALALAEELPPLLRLGDVLLELGRPTEARQRYERALSLAPGEAAALFGLGRVAAASDDWARAVELFEKVLGLQPEASVVEYPLGQAYRRLGDVDQARQHLARRGDVKVRFADPLGDQVTAISTTTAFEIVLGLARSRRDEAPADFLGFALGQLAGVPGAIEELTRAVETPAGETAPTAFEGARIRYVLGGLLVAGRRDAEAVERFAQAVELDPTLDDARVKQGNALGRLGRLEEAERAYDAVLARRPDDPAVLVPVLVLRAVARLGLGKADAARVDLERAIALDPRSSEANLRLAAILEPGDPGAAASRYESALALDLTPRERAGALLRLGALRAAAGDPEGALARYREARTVEPDGVEALGALGSLLGRLRRFEEAAEAYAAWVALDPRDVDPRLALAVSLLYGERWADAKARLEETVTAFPRHLGARGMLARHLAACPDRAVRDGARAVALATEVLAARPTPENRQTLAMAYAEAGRFPDAVAAQEELLRNLPPETDAPLRRRLEEELALYRGGRSCCP